MTKAQPEFANVGELFEKPDPFTYLSEEDQKAIAELEVAARARIEADQGDPRSQSFFMRLDTKTVVKDEKEYEWCRGANVALKVIPYKYALHLLKEEDARKRQRLKNKRKKKVARKARKANR